MEDFKNQLLELSNRVLGKALTEEEQNSYTESLFESIKHINEYGEEFWYARELQKALEYTEFNKIMPVIKKAMIACEQSGNKVSDHFAEVSEMVQIGSGVQRDFPSYALSRFAYSRKKYPTTRTRTKKIRRQLNRKRLPLYPQEQFRTLE